MNPAADAAAAVGARATTALHSLTPARLGAASTNI